VKRTFRLAPILVAFATFSLTAQTPPSVSPEQLQQLEALADQVKAALQQNDLNSANRLASNLMTGIYKQLKAVEPTPQAKLAALEQAAPTGIARFYALSKLAKTAFEAGELTKAESYARELLSLASGNQKDWNYGNAIFDGNMVLGRVVLRRDKDVPLAKTSLLAAAATPGSPQLDSFGPNMSLAKDLLTQGERDVVLQFFTRCTGFWKMGATRLENWTAAVKGGGIPDFGPNLLY